MVRISIPTLPPAPILPPNALTKLPVREAAAYLAKFLEKGKAAAPAGGAGGKVGNGKGVDSSGHQPKHGIGTVLITGAGVSVDSGIRAYRGKEGHYSNPNYKPILYHELVEATPRGEMFRKRYWARSFLGYPPVRDAKPNPTHIYVAALQMLGLAPNLITQNVDNLHPKALSLLQSHLSSKSKTSSTGSRPIKKPSDIHHFTSSTSSQHNSNPKPTILELHGTLAKVHCLKARHERARDEYQEELAVQNPVWEKMAEEAERTGVRPRTNPDGDVELHGVDFSKFAVPPCTVCASEGHEEQVVKPNVVFFGETLAPHVKDESLRLISEASQLLVLGTSLATYSAFRLVKQAVEQGKPVLMISTGPSRADKLEGVEKMDRRAGEVLRVYLEELIKDSSGPEVDAVKACLDLGIVTPPPEVEGPRAEG